MTAASPIPVDEQQGHFGKYQLCYELASGGMGTVYLARQFNDDGSHRLVAIKRIHPHLARKQAFVEMFLDESRITSRIDHPNVCRVVDFGDVDGTYYIAMEYLEGETLHDVVNRAADSPGEIESERWRVLTSRILSDAALGLHAAHELRGETGQNLSVVHRDVSPHNIFVTFAGSVRVLDFGVALAEERKHKTVTGTVKGKYAYMAPEQIGGRRVDRRADVWSLGVCLWEALTGIALFDRSDLRETLRAIDAMNVETPSLLCPSVPPGLDAICMGALQRDADFRTPSAEAFAHQLREYVLGTGEPAADGDVAMWLGQHFEDGRTRQYDLRSRAVSMVSVPTNISNADTQGFARVVPSLNTRPMETPEARGDVAPSDDVATAMRDARPSRPGDPPAPQHVSGGGPVPAVLAGVSDADTEDHDAPPVAAVSQRDISTDGTARPAGEADAPALNADAQAAAAEVKPGWQGGAPDDTLPPEQGVRRVALHETQPRSGLGLARILLIVLAVATAVAAPLLVEKFWNQGQASPERTAAKTSPVAASAKPATPEVPTLRQPTDPAGAAPGAEAASGLSAAAPQPAAPSAAAPQPAAGAQATAVAQPVPAAAQPRTGGQTERAEERRRARASQRSRERRAPREPRARAAATTAATAAPTTSAATEAAESRVSRGKSSVEADRGKGFVNVVATGGWADIYVSGRHLGRTPRRVQLPIGKRVLTLKPFGKDPAKTVSVKVKRDEVVRVAVPVQAPQGE